MTGALTKNVVRRSVASRSYFEIDVRSKYFSHIERLRTEDERGPNRWVLQELDGREKSQYRVEIDWVKCKATDPAGLSSG